MRTHDIHFQDKIEFSNYPKYINIISAVKEKKTRDSRSSSKEPWYTSNRWSSHRRFSVVEFTNSVDPDEAAPLELHVHCAPSSSELSVW